MSSTIQGLQVNDYGIPLEIQFELGGKPIDFSADPPLDIKFYLDQPDGTGALTRTGVLSTDGQDGKVKYVIAPGDLTKFGAWRFQARVVTGTLRKYSRKFPLDVASDLA